MSQLQSIYWQNTNFLRHDVPLIKQKKKALNLEWFSPFCLMERNFLVLFACNVYLSYVKKKPIHSESQNIDKIYFTSPPSLIFGSQFWHLYHCAVTSFVEFGSIPWHLNLGALITSSLFYTSWQELSCENIRQYIFTWILTIQHGKITFILVPVSYLGKILLLIHVVNLQSRQIKPVKLLGIIKLLTLSLLKYFTKTLSLVLLNEGLRKDIFSMGHNRHHWLNKIKIIRDNTGFVEPKSKNLIVSGIQTD